MTKNAAALAVLAAALVPLVSAGPAGASPVRVWVSNVGVDNASCGAVTAPCKGFQQAVSNVAAGGEVSVLTPGDFGQVSIGKAVSISNDGSGEAGISLSGGSLIGIAAGAGDVVSLRGLLLDGQASAALGVVFTTGSALHVQNCVIRNMEGAGGLHGNWGLVFFPSGSSKLFVEDSLIYNNGSVAASGGVFISANNGGGADAVLDRLRLENNVIGLQVDNFGGAGGAGTHVVLRDSVLSGNASHGIRGTATSGSSSFLFVKNTASVNNAGTGIVADGSGSVHGTILLSNNTVSRNGTGVSAVNGGGLWSYGNNNIDNNVGVDISGAVNSKTLN